MNTATVISPQNAGKGQNVMTIIDNRTDLHKGFAPTLSSTTGGKIISFKVQQPRRIQTPDTGGNETGLRLPEKRDAEFNKSGVNNI